MDEEDNYNLIHLEGYGLYRNHHVLVFPRYFCSLKEFMDNNSQGLSLRAIRSIAHSVSAARRNHAVDSDIPVSAAQQRHHSHGYQTTQPFVRISILQGRFAGRDGAAHSQQPDSFNRSELLQQRLSEAIDDLSIAVLAISGSGSPTPLRHEDRCLEFGSRPSRALSRLHRIPRSGLIRTPPPGSAARCNSPCIRITPRVPFRRAWSCAPRARPNSSTSLPFIPAISVIPREASCISSDPCLPSGPPRSSTARRRCPAWCTTSHFR